MIEKPKRPKKPDIQERQPPRTLQELINRYDLDNTKVYDFLDELVGQINENDTSTSEDISSITEDIASLQSQINDKNIITIGLNADTTTTSTSAYQNIDLSLTNEVGKVGTKLSLSSGKVLIGAGVSKILVSGKIQTQGESSQWGISIRKNSNTALAENFEGTPGTSWSSLVIPPIPASVTQGDIIKLSIYHNVANTTKPIKAYGGRGTYLTVEVIE